MTRIRQKGVAAVEMAIFLIPLVLIAFGTTELGRALYQYNTLLKATRTAARYLSVQSAGEGIDQAKRLAVYGTTSAGDTALLPNLTLGMVSDPQYRTIALDSNLGSINVVTVTITGYPFSSLVPFIVPDITFGPVSTTMRSPD